MNLDNTTPAQDKIIAAVSGFDPTVIEKYLLAIIERLDTKLTLAYARIMELENQAAAREDNPAPF